MNSDALQEAAILSLRRVERRVALLRILVLILFAVLLFSAIAHHIMTDSATTRIHHVKRNGFYE